jgi:hypothetical protein
MDKSTKAAGNQVIATGAVDLPLNKKPTQIGVADMGPAKLQAEQVYNECITIGNKVVALDTAKGELLRGIIKHISGLTSDAHIAYRNLLEADLRQIKEDMKSFDVDVKAMRGYTMGSYIVMVSNWKTISKAFQNGMVYNEDADWETVRLMAVEMGKAQASAKGESKGAGRKVKTELGVVDKIMNLIGQLNEEEMAEFTERLDKEYTVAALV